MADVIEFPKPAEPMPDAEHVCIVVENGQPIKWFEFTCTFSDGETEYSFRLWARDFADAERRLNELRATARVDGQLYAIEPA